MITGEKTMLRPIVFEDIEILNRWKNDEETFKYLGGGFSPISIDQQKQWLDNLIDLTGNHRRYLVCLETGSPIGFIGLYDINWINRTAEIGIYIGEKEARGHGYAYDATTTLEAYAKDYLNIRKLKIFVITNNLPAIKMWMKLGYQKIGEYQKERYIRGEYLNLSIMEKFL
ncbi:MAG: GNAT family N-acetyltransferase [Sphaerochaetaceae bacterium]